MAHDDLHVLDPGRFEDVRQVGAGNHATVFAAWDRELERAVAIKVPTQDTLLDVFGGERLEALGIAAGLQQLIEELGAAAGQHYTLLREARLLAAIDHPSVIRVLEVGQLDGSPAVVMPLLDGGSLAERSFDGSWREPLALALELGEGLAAVHRAGLLHRDFKPNNVLFDSCGRPVIADFGLACRIDDARAMADWAGTQAYMAPETRSRRSRDHRDDLYAFCVVSFEMLYGHRPFASDTARARGQVTRIERPIRLPEAVRDALVRGLAPDPDQRWPDMDSLLAALREACRDPRPRRWPYLLTGAAAAALLALLASSPVVHADTCGELVGHELDDAWNEARAAELRGALGSDAPGAALSRWATRYLEVRRHACEQARSDTAPPPSPCMRAARREFGLAIETVSDATLRAGLDLDAALAELPAPERCLDQPNDAAAPTGLGVLELRELDLAVAFALALDDDARASASLAKLAETARTTGSAHALARVDYWRGRLARRAGRLDEAATALAVALDAAGQIEANTLWAEAALELGELALARDEPDAALAYVQLAHTILSRHLPARLPDLLELEARALVATDEPDALVRARLDQAQTLRELELRRYELSTRQLEQTLAVRAELELELGDPDTAMEVAERGLSLARAREHAPVEHAQVFRRLLFEARLAQLPRGEHDVDASTPLHTALNELLTPWVFAGDEEALAAEYMRVIELYERAGFDVDAMRANPPRVRLN